MIKVEVLNVISDYDKAVEEFKKQLWCLAVDDTPLCLSIDPKRYDLAKSYFKSNNIRVYPVYEQKES